MGTLELYDLASDDGFDVGMTWLISSLLQSPHFLYRPNWVSDKMTTPLL